MPGSQTKIADHLRPNLRTFNLKNPARGGEHHPELAGCWPHDVANDLQIDRVQVNKHQIMSRSVNAQYMVNNTHVFLFVVISSAASNMCITIWSIKYSILLRSVRRRLS